MIKNAEARALMMSALNQTIAKFDLSADEAEAVLLALLADIRQQINIENVNEMIMRGKEAEEDDE